MCKRTSKLIVQVKPNKSAVDRLLLLTELTLATLARLAIVRINFSFNIDTVRHAISRRRGQLRALLGRLVLLGKTDG